jgi:stage V sporulation protein K
LDRKPVSKKDEIILQQLEVIRTMTENNLNRMGTDFWGSPAAPEAEKPAEERPRVDRPPEKPTASSTGNDATEPPAAEAPPPRRRSRISRRSWRATSALPR